MKFWVLLYGTEYEGETLWGVTRDEAEAKRFSKLRKDKLGVCDDWHRAVEFDFTDSSQATILETKDSKVL